MIHRKRKWPPEMENSARDCVTVSRATGLQERGPRDAASFIMRRVTFMRDALKVPEVKVHERRRVVRIEQVVQVIFQLVSFVH